MLEGVKMDFVEWCHNDIYRSLLELAKRHDILFEITLPNREVYTIFYLDDSFDQITLYNHTGSVFVMSVERFVSLCISKDINFIIKNKEIQ